MRKGVACAQENGPSLPEEQRNNSGNTDSVREASSGTDGNALAANNIATRASDATGGKDVNAANNIATRASDATGGNAVNSEDEENDGASLIETDGIYINMPRYGRFYMLPEPNLPEPPWPNFDSI